MSLRALEKISVVDLDFPTSSTVVDDLHEDDLNWLGPSELMIFY